MAHDHIYNDMSKKRKLKRKKVDWGCLRLGVGMRED